MENRISVIIPCYNEEKNIYRNAIKIFNYLKKRFKDFEIIIVNDGSDDGTIEELKRLENSIPIRIINNKENQGKGRAVRDGILKGNCDFIMFVDADLPVRVEEIERFLAEIKRGYDIVIASRFLPGAKLIIPAKWYRKMAEKIFMILRMTILNTFEIKDTQCGFKMFKGEVAKKIFSKSKINGFAFEAEIIFLAKKFGYKIKEIPVPLQNPQESHVRIFKDPFQMFFDLIKIRVYDFFKKY
jgi:dolichyl-phosphate beta-glucosyltransferase